MQTNVENTQPDLVKLQAEIARLKKELLKLMRGDAVTKNDQFIKNLSANPTFTASFCEVMRDTLNHLDTQKTVNLNNGVVSFAETGRGSALANRIRVTLSSASNARLAVQPKHVHSGYTGPVYERD